MSFQLNLSIPEQLAPLFPPYKKKQMNKSKVNDLSQLIDGQRWLMDDNVTNGKILLFRSFNEENQEVNYVGLIIK